MPESTNVDCSPEVSALVVSYDGLVTYVPLQGEVPFKDYIDLSDDVATYVIEPRANLDPYAEAVKALEAMEGRKVAILIPGRRFDAAGTRHGRGGGWYDRFLSRVPDEWQRIGFCYRSQFSEEPLKREAWDALMDAVIVADPDAKIAVVRCPDRSIVPL